MVKEEEDEKSVVVANISKAKIICLFIIRIIL